MTAFPHQSVVALPLRPQVRVGQRAKEIETRDVGLSGIAVLPSRLRPLRQEIVDELARSMRKQGLLQPIILRKAATGFYLVAGLHRYHAAKKLGWKTIRAQVFPAWGEAEALLAEIDENLIRSELTPAQRAKLTAQRKGAYQKAHPETKHGGAPGKAGGGKAKGAKLASFATETAARTGKSVRAVKRDATRADRLGADLDRVVGTSLDKGAELDALAAMPAPARQAIISRAANGETVSALRSSLAPEKRGKDAVRVRVLEGVSALVGIPTPREVAGYFRDTAAAGLLKEKLPVALAWLIAVSGEFDEGDDITAEAASNSVPLARNVNLITRKLDDLLDRWCENFERWHASHREAIEQEQEGPSGMTAKGCLMQTLHHGADKLLQLAQALDGR